MTREPNRRRWRRSAVAVGTLAAVAFATAGATAAGVETTRTGVTQGTPTSVEEARALAGPYGDRFLEMYDKIKDPANGYFSDQGIPYHAVETLMVEAPDYGHETTSEAYSFWLWLEASYGELTGDWAPFNDAWDTLEAYMIPTTENQPTNGAYNPAEPATYAPEHGHPSEYPSELDSGVSVGTDPIADELSSTYGTDEIYGMHWLADVDNVYGFGAAPGSSELLGPDYEGTSYINTFQRGEQESVWETIPQPSIDDFSYGGPNGYLDLFTGDAQYAQQWKYTNAPDADARSVEAVYWAKKFAEAQGAEGQISGTVDKASKMGDYLRYSLFDKYYKEPGCESPSCPAGSGKSSAHYLLSWYYAWGGALDTSSPWAWRIGSSHAHFGYQNPMAAWALSNDPDLIPASASAESDWAESYDRQVEFFQWLQSDEGGIAGGATNSVGGDYSAHPAGTPTFYGMAYDVAPVYHDPPSNQWFGMQGWGVERIAQIYHETGDSRAEEILEKWVPWVISEITITDTDWAVPATLSWTGAPDTWNPDNPGDNSGLHVEVTDHGQDVGVAGAIAKTLTYWAAASGDQAAADTAGALLDAIYEQNTDDLGVSTLETRSDYSRFDDVYEGGSGDGIYVPSDWSGTYPNGDVIEPGVSFLDIRSFYEDDPMFAEVQEHLDGGPAPEFRYHRFWAQTAVATAFAEYDRLIADPRDPGPTPTPTDDPTDPPTDDPTDPPTDDPESACEATLTVVNSWDGGFQAAVRVTANEAVSGWSTSFDLSPATFTQGWNAQFSTSGSQVTASDVGWNGSLPAGGSTEFGFLGNGSPPSSATVGCTAD
ncbi:glycoside hydrolase family 48 protein [Myceligenerans salitolerans]|uniref:Cellulose binding domain-containing protein n=1 Tax=Myceligenerans salitolerans TaxID=1230528 RepID=A0ABS3I441_9MICO|nr:glycoside hydrolase family 48 protein [Myceligenerans salitolerans]MBO0607774.1 cellulose binding domain-containing protein [Myceligenerans salitolerans]